MRVRDEDIQTVVEKVDGIAGWLAFYGYTCVAPGGTSYTIVKTVTEKAMRLVSKELEELFRRSSYSGMFYDPFR